ncbi:MAG TPA: flavin reductase family protein [bacterium]|nr:flavin reductase family protein [bacterium]
MIIDPRTLDRAALNGLINGLVIPRPIAWVSTLSAQGQPNLAPFSFFNAFSFFPPTVAIGPGSRQGVNKDTLRNIRATGEFAISLVSEALARLANATGAEFPPEVNEWEALGIEGADCVEIRPQRVAASPAAFECKLLQIVDLGAPELPTNSLVIGRVVRIHVDDAAMDGMRPRSAALRLVARMGGTEWCRTTDTFHLMRPASADPAAVRRELDEGQ